MATPSDPNLNKIDMVNLTKVTKVKVGDRIDFYLFGKLEEGVVYRIEEWDEDIRHYYEKIKPEREG